MRIDIVTIFPEYLAPLDLSLVGKARGSGLVDVRTHQLRDWTHDRHRTVDDTPYGGGAGMVMRVDVVDAALEAAYGEGQRPRIAALTASGRQFDERLAVELAAEPHVALLCGRYEGFDERILEHVATDVVSIGPYVLSGGELPAMVVLDAVARRLPGAIREESAILESFSEALAGGLEFPQYTRPVEFRGWRVPEVLLSGDHGRIEAWRLERSRERSAT